MTTIDLDYKDGDLTCRGVLAYDPDISGKRPGILVVHEAFGLGEHAIERAERLAALGYVALAADMFGARKQATDLPSALALIGDLRTDAALLSRRAMAGLNALAAQPQVDTSRLGGIGFCFGGATVLRLARDGTDLKGVVSFHGALATPTPAAKGAVKASVLVCTGADDPLVPTAEVNAFEEEMRQAGADWQVIAYGGTVHSFTNKAADGTQMPGIKYHAQTDARSWLAMQNFFTEVFA